ncbi:MAG: dihydropteroate synthase [Chthoniobacterales bacterium]
MREVLWKIGGHTVDLAQRGWIMGVLNVTPDSFFDGGEYFTPEKAVERGLELAAEGADIIDIGGESTRPGAEPIGPDEELRRVIPVIERIGEGFNAQPSAAMDGLRRGERPMKILSIDTSKAQVARTAIEAGASIVNDVTGGRGDTEMMPLIADRNVAFIIMHMQGNPQMMQREPRYVDVVAEVADFFRQQYGRALECGIDPMAIAFDPGIGFGKTLAHNLELLANLDRLRAHGRPLVIGVSRKSFLGKLVGSNEMRDRLAPAVALTALLRARGVNVFRVHDVKEHANALRVAEAVLMK